MSVKNRIWMLPLLAIAIFAVGIATVLAFSASTSKSITELGSTDYPYLDATTQFASQLEALGATIQGAVAEGDKKRLDEANDKAAVMRKTIAGIKAIPGKADVGDNLGKLFEAYFTASNDTAQMFLGTKTGDQAAAVASMQGAQKALESGLKAMRDNARTRFDAGLAGAQGGVSHSLYATLASALLVVVGLGVGSYFVIGSVWRQLGGEPEYARDVMRRIAAGDLSQDIQVQPGATNSLLAAVRDMSNGLAAIVGEVRSGSSRMRSAAQEIASGNQDLSERTEMQAASLERTTARMHQLTETVQSNASNAHQASDLASSASTVASRGGAVVSQVVSTMNEINASSKKISDIIGVIDGIAFQTNILALNAAVEAARAGEQGRGFAVVAGEVRNLAQRSAEAAKEIKSLIGASVDRVESGSKLVRDAGSTMTEIVESVARVATIINEITAAAAEQSRGIGEVNGDVSQLDEMTQRNAALVEEAAAAAASMEQQSEGLEAAVATFKLNGDHQLA
ncbi:MAG: chemotaxis protein [Caulobacter sp.]|nr:chemotaxis protein [Vitreoscilla sp.]